MKSMHHPHQPHFLRLFVVLVSASLLSSCQAVRESSLAAIAGPAICLSKPFFRAKGCKSGEKRLNHQPFKGTARLDHVSGSLFFFDHDPEARLSCTLKREKNDSSVDWTICPKPFLTDGASVPRALWCLSGFGPFDFTKSAIIHDWLFEGHHRWCVAFHKSDIRQMLRYRDYADPKLTAQLPSKLREQMWPLSIVEASDIIAECIESEGRLNSDVIKETSAIDADQTVAKGLRAKLANIVRATLAPARLSATTARQYHWATRSSEALRLWNADADGHPDHASSAQLIHQLDSGPKPTLLDQALNDGSLSPSLVKRLRRSAHEE
jgi:hypothetical protein